MLHIPDYAAKCTDFRDKLNALRNAHFPVWEMERLGDFVNYAIRELSPLQIGDTAELVSDENPHESSGWYCHRHTLVAGKRGRVHEVNWMPDTGWSYSWEPEEQTWISSQDGKERPVDRPYHYMMNEKRLRKVSQ